MAKTMPEKLESVRKEIEQLKNEERVLQKKYSEQQRKLRTKRLCKRMGLIESLLPGSEDLTDEQFTAFIKGIFEVERAKEKVKEMLTQNESTIADQQDGTNTTPLHGGNNAVNTHQAVTSGRLAKSLAVFVARAHLYVLSNAVRPTGGICACRRKLGARCAPKNLKPHGGGQFPVFMGYARRFFI